MSSATLPEFRKGEPLTAEGLNALASRIRALQGRGGAGIQLGGRRVRRVIPGRHFAFQLAELNGCIWFRQGWLDVGGELVRVGDAEWNVLGAMGPCTVWLNVSREVVAPAAEGDGEPQVVVSATVEVGELDIDTPETNLRRRLGYVRQEEGEDGSVGVWHAVQLLGGVVAPCAPRRQMGTANAEEPSRFRKSDAGQHFLHAGDVAGSGYRVGEREVPGRRVSMAFYNQLEEWEFPAAQGGRRIVQVLGLA